MTSIRVLRLVAAATFAAASTVSIHGAAAASPEPQADWRSTYRQYEDDGDKGGVSISEQAKTDNSYVSANFRAKGENLRLHDYHNNDRSAVARLWVGGSGPAVFYSDGDGSSRKITHLSYAEGQSVYLQVCTSDHPNAVCTSEKKYKGTT